MYMEKNFIGIYFISFLFCAIISAYDIKHLIIPDSFLCIFFLTIFSFDVLYNFQKISIKLVFCILFFLIFYFIRRIKSGFGLGDVKFCALLSYVFSFWNAIIIFFIACFLAILFFLINQICFSKKIVKLPFAPFLSLGVLVSFLFMKNCFYGESFL